MKTLDELKEFVVEMTGREDIIVFDNPSYVTAVVGISHDDRVIYSFEKMVEYLMETDKMEYEEAIEFIEYNTLRAMPYYPDGPIVLMDEEQTKFFYED